MELCYCNTNCNVLQLMPERCTDICGCDGVPGRPGLLAHQVQQRLLLYSDVLHWHSLPTKWQSQLLKYLPSNTGYQFYTFIHSISGKH